MIYTVTFNPALDYVMNVNELQTKDVNRTESEALYYGGKGINVSVILSRLGFENKALGFIAGFTGRYIEEMLKKDNIKTDFIYLENGYTRINVKIRAEQEYDINAQGPEISQADIFALYERLDKLKAGDCLVLAGSVPKTLPNDIYENILKRLENKGVDFVVDATGDLLLNVLKFKPFMIKPNHLELGELFSVEIKTLEDIKIYGKKLQEMGAKNVLVSRGKHGAALLDENGVLHKMGNVPGKIKNTVGCGDSMVAGFLAGYFETKDYDYALRLGSACGNATAFCETLATRAEINEMLLSEYLK
ncbi:MAG: 1-phosphofructokinase [Eubacterium sp.]|nr:1-phosphofructokinase [Eubacterium sp.]